MASAKWSKIALGVVLVAGASIAGVKAYSLRAKPRDSKLFVIKTWTRKDCSVTPWTIADRLGFLKDEGIALQFTGETQPALQVPSIIRGDNDVHSFHPNTLAVAKAGGAKLTGVAEGGIEPTDPKIEERFRHMWWFVNPTKHPDIKTFADIAKIPGKVKITTITTNICADFETKLLADRYNIPRDKIEWVTMPDVQAIQSLKQGLVDISEVHPPFYLGMKEAGALKIADSSETGLGASAGVTYYAFRDEFIKQHPEEVAAFARAMRKAQIWANEHPAEAGKLTEEAIGQPVRGYHYYSTNIRVDESLAQPWLDDLVRSGVIKPGSVTTKTLITHEIEERNLTVASRE